VPGNALRAQAQAGQRQAQFDLAVSLFLTSDEATREALHWFTQADAQQVLQAKAYLAFLWSLGQPMGITPDLPKAVALARAGAEQGDPFAQAFLGSMYQSGLGVPQDLAQAFVWEKKAADSGWLKAQYNVAQKYLLGEGVGANPALAEHFLDLAAQAGDLKSQRQLVTLYLSGQHGFAKRPDKAFAWLEEAAKAQDPKDLTMLGVMHFKGLGTRASAALGRQHLQAAAALGFGDALVILAELEAGPTR
jgi:hypothetical protein